MILVTGATGTVGSELVQKLLAGKHAVRVLTRDKRKVAHLDNQVECAEGDFDKVETLTPAMQGVDQLFLVTLGTSQQDINAVAAAKRAAIKHIVKLSTMEAKKASIQIGKWHREREQIIEASGIAWTFLRPGMFMSNFAEWWVDSIKSTGRVFFPGGKGKVAPIHPVDVAAAAATVLTQPGHSGRAYELTGPELFDMGEIVNIIGSNLGKRLQYVNIPAFVASFWMRRNGMPPQLVGALMELAAELRNNRFAVRTDTFEELTGYPAHTLQMWCQDNMAQFK